MMRNLADAEALDAQRAWRVLRELARRARDGQPLCERAGFSVAADDSVLELPAERACLWVEPRSQPCFGASQPLAPSARTLLELYLPLCVGEGAHALVIAHLGQSLDGQVATSTGDSRYVTSDENLSHVHRLRALCDAVLVGAGTVARDDPQLTTRRVEGESPTRVIIDPTLRTTSARLWRDGAVRTVVVCEHGRSTVGLPSAVEVVSVPSEGGTLAPLGIVRALRERGLSRLLVEGGGLTVSRFVEARVVNRLHICVSPLLMGSGRPGLVLPAIDRLEHAVRPKNRRFDLGDDVLFDCELDVPDP